LKKSRKAETANVFQLSAITGRYFFEEHNHCGPRQAGKTTLAKKNEELNCFVISVYKLVAAFDGAYPELNIRLNRNRDKTTGNIAPFLGHFL
jgi:hypothetical protein